MQNPRSLQSSPARPRVWVLGLDGVPWTLLQPWIDQGHLPALAGLQAGGAWGELQSTLQFLTAVAWSSFITGMNPGKHGVFDFARRIPGSYDQELTNASLRSGRSLWRVLSDAGRRVGVVNVPMTFPPEAVNGFLISGLDTPGLDSAYTYPASLKPEVNDVHFIAVSTIGKSHQDYLAETLIGVDKRFELLHRTIEREPLDFYMWVEMETDAIQHCSWRLMDDPDQPNHDAILQVYKHIDFHLQKVIANLPQDVTLVVMSDHGAGPIVKTVYLDRWLAQRGWLHLRQGEELSLADRGRHAARIGVKKSMHLAQRFLPVGVKGYLKRYTGAHAAVESFIDKADIDWSRTKAYSTGNLGNINLNIIGRDPEGVIRPDEVESVIAEITAALLELRNPDTGELMVAEVLRREQIYTGDLVDLAPDLLIRWTDDKYLATKDYEGKPNGPIFGTKQKFGRHGAAYALDQTGTHIMEGFCIFYGYGVEPQACLQDARLIDLAPTILHLQDVPIPRSMDGRVLLEALTPEFARKPVRYEDQLLDIDDGPGMELSDEEEEEIRARLQGLGYVA
ncbi:MAG: alkaline phosphatase family protein [Caldilineales bacterium]|nr:alkaline phosphatase family protein [Caldilineales bacterium]